MNFVTLIIALGLATMWVVALSAGSAAPWFTWLVFVAAAFLLAYSFIGFGYKRRSGKPI